MRELAPDALVDPVAGIVRRVKDVRTPDDAPASYTSMTAEVSDARRLGDWPADRVSLGTTFGDRDGAWIAAVAEAMERYCGNYLPAKLPDEDHVISTRRELVASGRRPIGLDQLPQWAPWQLERPGFEYEQLGEDTPALWARCQDSVHTGGDGTEFWWPSALVHLNWRQRRLRHLPRVLHLNYAGIATGQGVDDATDRAVLEVIERDALEIWWHLGGPAVQVDPATVPGLVEQMGDCRLEYWAVMMPSEFAPCAAALVRDPSTGIYAAGFACRNDPAEAVRKAMLEAVHTWIYTEGTVDADGWVFQAVSAGLMADGLYLRHRADAGYLDDAGEQFERVRDLGAHVQIWQDPRTHELAGRFTDQGDPQPVSAFESVGMDEVYRRLRAAGHPVHIKDLTTPDVGLTSLRVVRALVPGLVPNAPAAFAYLGSPRLLDAAMGRGWRTERPSRPEDFTLVPPPHM